MGKKTRMNRLLVVVAVALIAVVWSFTALVDTAWATKPSDPGGGKPGGGGDGTTPVYHQVHLGTLNPAQINTYPTAINEAGQVVGVVSQGSGAFIVVPLDTDGDAKPDTWYQDIDGDGLNDLMIDLGIPKGDVGFTSSDAKDVNCFGQVVGRSLTDTGIYKAILVNPEDADGDGQADTWYRDRDGDGANDLMVVMGDILTWAINDVGQVIDFDNFLITPTVVDGAQVWFLDDDGDGFNDLMIDLGTLGGDWIDAWDINNLGQVVGQGERGDHTVGAFLINPTDSDGDGQPDTWYRDDDGDGLNDLMVDLMPSEIATSGATTINDAGQIGGSIDVDGHGRAYLLTPEDTNEDGVPDSWFRDQDGDGFNDLILDLGVLSKMESSYVQSINNLAQVVGRSSAMQGGKYGTMHITHLNYVWENGEMKELDPLTDSDARLGSPWDINDAGQIVTDEGYILLPIEPTP